MCFFDKLVNPSIVSFFEICMVWASQIFSTKESCLRTEKKKTTQKMILEFTFGSSQWWSCGGRRHGWKPAACRSGHGRCSQCEPQTPQTLLAVAAGWLGLPEHCAARGMGDTAALETLSFWPWTMMKKELPQIMKFLYKSATFKWQEWSGMLKYGTNSQYDVSWHAQKTDVLNLY